MVVYSASPGVKRSRKPSSSSKICLSTPGTPGRKNKTLRPWLHVSHREGGRCHLFLCFLPHPRLLRKPAWRRPSLHPAREAAQAQRSPRHVFSRVWWSPGTRRERLKPASGTAWKTPQAPTGFFGLVRDHGETTPCTAGRLAHPAARAYAEVETSNHSAASPLGSCVR